MKITSFDKQNLKAVRVILQTAFDKVKFEYGIDLSIGTISFDSTSFRTTLKARVSGSGRSVTAPVSKYDDLESVCFAHGYTKPILTKEDLGKEFKLHTWDKETYIILGGQIRAYKFGVVAKSKKTGTEYKFTVSSVAEALGRKVTLSPMDQNAQDMRDSIAEGRAEARSS